MVVMATRLPQRARNPSADVVDIGYRCVGSFVRLPGPCKVDYAPGVVEGKRLRSERIFGPALSLIDVGLGRNVEDKHTWGSQSGGVLHKFYATLAILG